MNIKFPWNIKPILLGCMIALFMTLSQANAGTVFIAPEIGQGDIGINGEFSLNGSRVRAGTLSVSVSMGYKFDVGITFEGGLAKSTNNFFLGVSDFSTLDSQFVSLGYEFNVAEHLRIHPKIGYDRWDFKTKEGAFLNPGFEDRLNFSGEQSFWSVALEFPVSDATTLFVVYSEVNYDFGQSQYTRFGMQFNFE